MGASSTTAGLHLSLDNSAIHGTLSIFCQKHAGKDVYPSATGRWEALFVWVLLLSVKCVAHETWTTQASHIAVFVQQKSSATYKQFTSYGG